MSKEINKLVLFLMNRKGLKVLESIINEFGSDCIKFVVGAKDDNVQHDYFDDIKSTCLNQNISFYGRKNFPSYDNYAIAIGWRWIINKTERLIVLHDSLLPKYRGFAPLISALIKGDKEIGVTALFASDQYDEGEIIDKEVIEVSYPIKIKDAIEAISFAYERLTIRLLHKMVSGVQINSCPQDHSKATYSLWRDEEDYRVNWKLDAHAIKRHIDATGFPYRGASTLVNDQLFRIREVDVIDDLVIENRTPGKIIKILKGNPVVVCGQGLIKIVDMRFDGSEKSALPFSSFRTRFS